MGTLETDGSPAILLGLSLPSHLQHVPSFRSEGGTRMTKAPLV